jgi:membrane associated rhomboid family serine protease
VGDDVERSERTDRPDLDVPPWLRPFAIVAAMVAVMWAVEIVDLFPHTNFDRYGIRPRQFVGLVGVGTAPFLHAGFGHLLGNTIPFLILGGLVAASGTIRFLEVVVIVALISGLGTWLTGPSNSDHIGASGVVFGFLTYLIARGVFERKLRYLLIGVIVLLVFGGMVWGLFPHAGISWEGHVFGAIGGVVAAWVLHGNPFGEGGTVKPDRDTSLA